MAEHPPRHRRKREEDDFPVEKNKRGNSLSKKEKKSAWESKRKAEEIVVEIPPALTQDSVVPEIASPKEEFDDVAVTNEIRELPKEELSKGIEVDTTNALYRGRDARRRLQREMDDMANSPSVSVVESSDESAFHTKEKSESTAEIPVPHDAADAIDQKHVQEVLARSESTPLEWRRTLRELIEGAKNIPEGISERFAKSKEYLNARAKEIDAQAEMSGMEKLFRKMGENYNKLALMHKLGIGLTLGAGAVISVASFAPLMALGFGTALGAQRAFALGGMFVAQEKALQAKKAGESEQLLSVKERAMLNAMLYTLGMSFAIKEGVELANEYGVVERTREWLGEMLGHQPIATETPVIVADATPQEAMSPPEVSVPEAPPDIAVPPTQEYVAPAVTADIEAPPIPETPEVPSISVEATRGHGYEYMMKRVWEQLQDKGLDASQYAEGSDIRRLLEADAQSIDRVVHQIAADPEHGFFNQDGTSVRIDMGSQMTINADGDIELGDAVKAPEGAPVTPAYHPEAPVSDAEAPADMTYAPESVGEPYVETPPASSADEIRVQSPAPIEDRSFVSNEELPKPETYAKVDATSEQAASATSPNSVEIGPNGYVNSHGIPINPNEAHGYLSGEDIYVFGNDKLLEQRAQEYAQQHQTPVFVDKSYKLLGFINVSRVIEFVPTQSGPPAMVIHSSPTLVPDPRNFTKRIF